MNKLKVISGLALVLILALFVFMVVKMPSSPEMPKEKPIAPDLSDFDADTSSLNLPETMRISSVKKYEGRYYISDAIAKRVYCVDEDSNIIWESRGDNGFILPNSKFPLDISEDGNLWVANTGKLRLDKLDLNSGKFIASWQPSDKFKGCCNPVAMLALSEGRFLTMEKGVNLLKLYYPDGSGKNLQELKGNWHNYEIRKFNAKVEYCDGVKIKTIDIK